MRKILIWILAVAFFPFVILADEDALDASRQWPQWRGPLGTGVAPHGDPPVVWSEEQNVRWKLALPGVGHSTPIVWGDRLFLTTAIPYGEAGASQDGHADGAHDNMEPLKAQKFVVLAIDRHRGKILWQKTLRSERPHEGTHVTGSWASNSAVTDGQHLFVSFGSRGLYALDLDGKLLWQKDFGEMQTRHEHGEGSSPALFGSTLVVNWDHEGESFVAALDKHTGKQRWKVARDEMTSWSTPLVVEHGGKPQVVVSATKFVRSYDLATGDVVWQAGGLSRNVVASPVAGDGFVYVANSYDWQAMLGIRLEAAKGDITGNADAVVWTLDKYTPYVPSLLLYGDELFFLAHSQGFLTSLEAKTGRPLFGPERLPGVRTVFASPVGAADRVYVISREGTTAVVRRAAPFKVLARNQLDDSFAASPAVVGKELYLRGQEHLYCIAEPP
jgi:outer membrane protein assembly factor BamB